MKFTNWFNNNISNVLTTKNVDKTVRNLNDVTDAVGARTKALKATKGFGNSVNTAIDVIKEARKQYNYRTKINFGGNRSTGIEANIKSITRPSINFEYSETPVFNSIKRSIVGVSFEPVVMEIYDDLAGSVTNDIVKILKTDYLLNVDNELVDLAPIDLASYQQTKIKSIEIHSGSSPVNNLVGGVLRSLSNNGTGVYNEGNIDNMILSQCNLESIDFGNFDYSNESDPCTITMRFRYQSLSFGRTSLTKDTLSFAGSQIFNQL